MPTITLTAAQLYTLRTAVLNEIERQQIEQREPTDGIAVFADAAREREQELQEVAAVLRAASLPSPT